MHAHIAAGGIFAAGDRSVPIYPEEPGTVPFGRVSQ